MIVKVGTKQYLNKSLEDLKQQYPLLEERDPSWNDFIKTSYWIENDYEKFIVLPDEPNSHHLLKVFGVKNGDMEEVW